jgi:hypothetical protein
MLLSEEFIKSKPSDKLYYFALLHYMNLHEISYDGDFFKRDLDFAAALGYSEDSIRNARRKFQKLGWIDAKSGFRTKQGQNVATTYYSVKWKETPKLNEGKRFVRFPHYDFEMMLSQIHSKEIDHHDMVVYCYVVCWEQLNGAIGRPFYFPKKDLRYYTNIIKAVDCVKNLSQVSVFSGDEAVFDYTDDYHRLLFTKLRKAADPYRDENNRATFNSYLENHKRRSERLLSEKHERELKKAREKGIIVDPSQLVDFFREEYKKAYNFQKNPDISYSQEKTLIKLGEEKGLENVVIAIRKYFEMPDEKIPNPSGAKHKTLARFNTNFDMILGSLSGNP